jgi:hypothetical protein
MVRVDADSGDPDVLVSAYQGASSTRTAIILNRSTVPHRIQVDWPGGSFTVLEVSSPYAANEARKPLPKELVVQPGEIMTLSNVPLP